MKIVARVLVVVLVLIGVVFALRMVYRDTELRGRWLSRSDKHSGGALDRMLLFPAFSAKDANFRRIDVSLTELARGLNEPVVLAVIPPPFDALVALERGGKVVRIEQQGVLSRWLDVDVYKSRPEQGLLGIAFHPGFADNGRLFLSFTTPAGDGSAILVIEEYRVPRPKSAIEESPSEIRPVLRVPLPDAENPGGALAFGPDNMLYVALGDGGGRGDPKNHGQDPKTLLGSILRIDVEGATNETPYKAPKDNPFVRRAGSAPEIFALGVRAPRQLAFTPDKRLILLDSGERSLDEFNLVLPGDNLGWAQMEGSVCFVDGCKKDGMRRPFLTIEHDVGRNIIAGRVSTKGVLRGLYMFAYRDQGRLFATQIPDQPNSEVPIFTLGTWPLSPSAITSDAQGQLYLADAKRGRVYRVDPKTHHFTDMWRDMFDLMDKTLGF